MPLARFLLSLLPAALVATSLLPAPARANDPGQAAQRCEAGDRAACTTAGLVLSDPAHAGFDIFLSLRYLQRGCQAQDPAACGRLALIYLEGSDDVEVDRAMAGDFAQRACARQDPTGCEVAETIYADAGSPQFDAEKALRYRRVNCDRDRWVSCLDLARIYYNLEDHLPAEQVATKACGPGGAEREAACGFAATLRQRREQHERALEQQRQALAARAQARERASQTVRTYLERRDYDGAVYAAIYHSRSTDDAAMALEATLRAGAIGSLFKDHLYVLDYWFPSGPLNQAVNAEIRARSRASDCGIFNCTNMPGASTRRWQQAGGSQSSGYRSTGTGYTPSQPRMKSSAEIQRETRARYRHVHCTMGGVTNSRVCS